MDSTADAEDLTLDEYRALAEFRYRIRRFLRDREQDARAVGLEPQHYNLLLALKGLPPDLRPTISAVAERLQIKHQSAVELIDRLAGRGLIERSRTAPDRREVLVLLTPHGERVLQVLALHSRAELRSASPVLLQALNALAG